MKGPITAGLAVLLAAPLARAQVPTVQPDGSLSEPAAPPSAPAAPAAGPVQPIAPQPDSARPGTAGYYHTDDEVGVPDPDARETVAPGAVPAVHVVRSGDTLWDLSWSYFNNPWEWPRVWSYNPEITNPHWIYPGDQVRLRTAGPQAAPAAPGRSARSVEPVAAPSVADRGFMLRQLAFVAREDLALGMAIDGSPEEKLMLASGDEVYLSYPSGKPPRVGKRYAIYLEKERVRHPTRNEEVGAYVRIVGEVEIISAASDKRARGVLLDTVDVVERGMTVGPVARQFQTVEPAAAEADVEAIIVAEISSEELIGALHVVFLDRGSQHRVKPGNRFFVIRRGDAYEPVMGPPSGIGKNDGRYPARAIGEILVVQAGRQSSVAIVVRSDKELGVGDRALMNRAQERRGGQSRGGSLD
jgi:hypothetical protein